jgi:hypothetical protein
VIPENQRKAVADFERTVMGEGLGGGTESVTDERLMKGLASRFP